MIANGKPPGAGGNVKPEPMFLKVGDVMRLGVEGIGIRSQRIVAAKQGYWAVAGLVMAAMDLA